MASPTVCVVASATLGVAISLVCCGPRPAGGGDTAHSEPIVRGEPAMPPSDRGDHVVTGGDLIFLNAAAAGGTAEVAMGRLAVERTTSAEVKRFAERVITDHSKAGEALTQLAQAKQVSLPTEVMPERRATLAKLSRLNGAAFDRAYVKEMVADHMKDVTAFESLAKGAVDADVKAFATTTLPMITAHLALISKIAASEGASTTP